MFRIIGSFLFGMKVGAVFYILQSYLNSITLIAWPLKKLGLLPKKGARLMGQREYLFTGVLLCVYF